MVLFAQHQNFEAELEVFKLQPSSDSQTFRELVIFLSHVSVCYPKDLEKFPDQLMSLLREQGGSLHPDVRKCLVQSLALMRSRNLVDPVPVLKLYFELFRVQDKHFRQLLFIQIIQDIKTINKRGNNIKVRTSCNASVTALAMNACLPPLVLGQPRTTIVHV